jgi:glycerophosphoryl diester phosphodiesterase
VDPSSGPTFFDSAREINTSYSRGLRCLICCSKTLLILALTFLVAVLILYICFAALKNSPSPPPPSWIVGDVAYRTFLCSITTHATHTAMSKPIISNDTMIAIQVGHRGDYATSRENTLGSLVNASKHGATVVELDIQLSVDGVIVVAHDNMLDNFTNCKGKISDLPVANITSCIVTRGGYNRNVTNSTLNSLNKIAHLNTEPTKWNTVPTFQSFLDEASHLNMNLFIEMKNVQNKTLFIEQIKYQLDSHSYYNKSIVLSFFPDILKDVRSQMPQIFSLLLTRPDSISLYCNDPTSPKNFFWNIACIAPGFFDSFFQTVSPSIAHFVGAGAFGIEHHSLTSDIVHDLHSSGFLVAAWTVNTKEEKSKCTDASVDILISDCVYRYCPSRDDLQ